MADARVTKEKEQETEVNEAQIAVHWKEEQYFYPSAKFIGQAYLTDPAVDQRFSEKNFPECFREYADLLSWTSIGTPRSIPVTLLSGSGMPEASSTPVITALIVIWKNTGTKRHSSLWANRKTFPRFPLHIRSFI